MPRTLAVWPTGDQARPGLPQKLGSASSVIANGYARPPVGLAIAAREWHAVCVRVPRSYVEEFLRGRFFCVFPKQKKPPGTLAEGEAAGQPGGFFLRWRVAEGIALLSLSPCA